MIVIVLVLNLLLRLPTHLCRLLIILLILLLVLLLFLIFFECLKVDDSLAPYRWLLVLRLSPSLLELVDDASDPVGHLIDHIVLDSALSHLLQIQCGLSGCR